MDIDSTAISIPNSTGFDTSAFHDPTYIEVTGPEGRPWDNAQVQVTDNEIKLVHSSAKAYNVEAVDLGTANALIDRNYVWKTVAESFTGPYAANYDNTAKVTYANWVATYGFDANGGGVVNSGTKPVGSDFDWADPATGDFRPS
jgi:hypothetical protein